MSELTKKFMGEVAVEALVTNVKAEDAKTLQSAKDYADSLAKNYEQAGASNTAEQNAKNYTNEEIAKVNAEVAKKATTEALEAEAKARGDKDTELQGLIEATDAKAVKNAEDIAAINNAETGILKQAKDFATTEDAKVQANVDALAGKVGAVPENQTVMEIIANIQENAYDDTELRGLIDQKADKTQVATDIAAAVKIETDARVEAVAGVQGEIDALEKLHGEDKTALENAIALKADKTALDEVSAVANAAVKQSDYDTKVAALEAEDARIAGLVEAEATKAREEEGKLNTRLEEVEAFFKLAEGEQLDTALDTLKELQDVINGDGAVADQMLLDIAKNAEDIANHIATDHDFAGADAALKSELEGKINAKADTTVVTGIDGRLTTAEGKITVLEGDMTQAKTDIDAVEAAVATKVEQEAYNTKIAALEEADAGQVERIAALEAKFGEGEGNVEDMIADAKQEAIDTAAGDATTKANKALEDAKKYADEEDAKIELRVDALEAASATHALASDLTTLAGRTTAVEGKVTTLEGEMDAVEAAVATKAEQADLTALTGRVATEEGKVTELQGKMTAVETKASDNEDAIAELTQTHNEDKATLQAAIDANTSAINSFVALSKEEIDAMFA